MSYGYWFADGTVHDIVDDRDDNRELVTKCGVIYPWIHPKHRVGVEERALTCFACLTADGAQEVHTSYGFSKR